MWIKKGVKIVKTINIIYYVAEDGTRFTDRKNCEDYENNCIFNRLKEAGIKFFGKNFISCADATEAVEAQYIYFPENAKAYDLYMKYYDSNVIPIFVDFSGKGLYYYDDNSCSYQLIRNKVDEDYL